MRLAIYSDTHFLFLLQDRAYSLESSIELLEKDVVQLHAPRWQPMRQVCLPYSLFAD